MDGRADLGERDAEAFDRLRRRERHEPPPAVAELEDAADDPGTGVGLRRPAGPELGAGEESARSSRDTGASSTWRSRSAARKTVFFLTWANRERPQGPVTERYLFLAKSRGALVAPVGIAWQELAKKGIDLYDGSGVHPNLGGTYLSACVFYAFFTGKSPGRPLARVRRRLRDRRVLPARARGREDLRGRRARDPERGVEGGREDAALIPALAPAFPFPAWEA